MVKFTQRFGLFVELLLPWAFLLLLGFYTFANFFLRPYVGFDIASSDYAVGQMVAQTKAEGNLLEGDVIQRVGGVTAEDWANNLQVSFFEGLQAGDRIEMVVRRNGQLITVQHTLPGMTAEEVFLRLNSQWFTPYIFWMAGTASLFFLRPRSQLRLLLVLFCYLTAGWLGASGVSGFHFFNGALLLRSFIWLSAPVYLHLHWLFPTPLRRLPGWLWGLLYALCAVMAVVSWLQLVPANTYFIGFLLALAGSLVLIGVHLVAQPAERRQLWGLAAALGMVLLPALVIALYLVFNQVNLFSGIIVLGLAALPGFYFFTLFRRQLTAAQNRQAVRLVRTYVIVILAGLLFCVLFALLAPTPAVYRYMPNLSFMAVVILFVTATVNFIPFLVLPALANEQVSLGIGGLRFSANRAASGLVFLLLEMLLVLVLVFLIRLLNFPGEEVLSLLAAMLLMGAATLLFYPRFQRFFERAVLGMRLTPETLVKTYSGRITTSLEAPSLRKLLLEEVFPSLLVRQFAQVLLREGGLSLAFGLRVSPDMLPDPDQAKRLDALCGRSLDPDGSPLPGWMRVVVPLQINQQTSGYWLLGQRDPDDRYSEEDIATLQALAGQTALALVNIEQSDALRALYFADIDRHETERLHLATELHDDVLNQMATLNANLQDTSAEVHKAYDQAVFHIREIINGLRPAMLNYGLSFALEALADELNDRLAENPRLVADLPTSTARYDERVELYLFRIVQQACQNAIAHADCKTIRITGSLTDSAVELTVSDDGKGFPPGSRVDLPELLAHKHFGLAGMFERAALIGADLGVDSQTGQGSQVNVKWNAVTNT